MDSDPEFEADQTEPAPGSPPRPLQPPPTFGELLEVFRQRIALRHPGFDATRVVLATAALVGLSGMVWAMYGPHGDGGSSAPVRVAVSSSSTAAVSTTTGASTSDAPVTLIIDVAGAVAKPGPVRVHRDARVVDAIAAAGGPRADADLERVDRAARLSDGQRVYVPRHGQTEIPDVVGATGAGDPGASAPGRPTGADAADDATGAPVDLNTADETELDTLPGVGPATAQSIIDHRSTHGRFTSVDELLEVKGIGPAKLARIRSHATV